MHTLIFFSLLLFCSEDARLSRDNSDATSTPKLRLKNNQESFLRPKNIQEANQHSTSHQNKVDDQPKPKTRLSKLLSKSISSEKSVSSSVKEDDRLSDEPPTVVPSKQNLSGAEFLKDFTENKGIFLV